MRFDQELIRAALAEGLGALVLTLAAAAAICTDAYSGGQLGLIGVALAQGLALTGVVATLASVSGAHANPAVTVAALLIRAIQPLRAAIYVVAQIAGAVSASWLLRLVFANDVWGPVRLGAAMPGPGVTTSTATFVEMLLTFMLVFVILRLATSQSASWAALAIGGTLTLGVLIGGPLTGAALNPARAFGPALLAGEWTGHLAYWAGPLFGASAAAAASVFFSRTDDPGDNDA